MTSAPETSHSYAAFGPKQALRPWTFDLRALGPHDIEVKIVYSGICHSDIHTVRGEWGDQKWPIVPGHEIVGYVTKAGASVTRFQLGDRVGVGPQAMSCMACEDCNALAEPYCCDFLGTYGGQLPDGYITKGGYAAFHRVHERFAVRIPAALPSDAAAPLLCAGITCFSPLRFANVGPGMKVGICGLGGLGHLGVQLAAALGAEVTVLSTSDSKREEARRFGAAHFLNIKDAEQLKAAKRRFDMILNTASGLTDMGVLLHLVKNHGNLTNVGLPEENMTLPPRDFLRHVSFTGTLIGPPSQIEEMLELCVKHNIVAKIELSPFDQVNEAIEKVLRNEARYRIVLEVDPAYDKEHRGAK